MSLRNECSRSGWRFAGNRLGLPHRNVIVKRQPLEIEVSDLNRRGYQLSRFREDREDDLRPVRGMWQERLVQREGKGQEGPAMASIAEPPLATDIPPW